MVTLREFVTKILERGCHYRVYRSSRDDLIYESYFTVHSPIDIDPNTLGWTFLTKDDYRKNNDYCYNVYDGTIDDETDVFLRKYGGYEVFRVEHCGVAPLSMKQDEDGFPVAKPTQDKFRPTHEYVPCVNLFIQPYDSWHVSGCPMCFHSNRVADGSKIGYHFEPDPQDTECENCKYRKEKADGKR